MPAPKMKAVLERGLGCANFSFSHPVARSHKITEKKNLCTIGLEALQCCVELRNNAA
jgi:hypothetical protein